MKETNKSIYLLLILAMGLWGLSWTNGKILGEYAAPATLMFWRFILAAVAMIPVMVMNGTSWKVERSTWLYLGSSALFLTLYNLFYFSGTHMGSAGAGGVLVTTLNPILTVLFVSVYHRKFPNPLMFLGIVMGLVGGSFLLNLWGGTNQELLSGGNVFFLLCALTWVFLTLLSSKTQQSIHTYSYSFWVYALSAGYSLTLVDSSSLMNVFSYDKTFWLNLLAVSWGALAFATTIYFYAAGKLGSERAAAFIFTVPVSAMLFSMWLLDEPLTLHLSIGAVLSISAVYLIDAGKKRGSPGKD